MGYTTDFTGHFNISGEMSNEQIDFINLLSSTRRMKRNVEELYKKYKGKYGLPFHFEPTNEQKTLIEKLQNTGLNVVVTPLKDNRTIHEIYGVDGEYFVGQDERTGLIDQNTPPGQYPYLSGNYEQNQQLIKKGMCQPGLWCQWQIDKKNMRLVWDGGEKFYYYIDWLKYLINHFFNKWNVLLNGEITWQGEEPSDQGKIVIKNNVVTIKKAVITFVDEN